MTVHGTDAGRGAASTALKGRLVSGGVWTLVSTLLNGVAVIGGGAVLARVLSPADFGGYLLAASTVAIAGLLASFGLNRSVVRLVAHAVAVGDVAGARGIAQTALGIGMIGAVVCAGVLYLGLAGWIAHFAVRSEALADAVGVVSLWLIPATISVLVGEIFRGFHDIRRAAVFGATLGNVVSLFLFIAVAVTAGAATLYVATLLSLVGSSAGALVGIVALWRRFRRMPAARVVRGRELFSSSLPLWVTTATTYVLSQADIWIVGIFRTQADVAMYGAAAKLMILIAIPLAIVNGVIQPVVTELHGQQRRQGLQRLLRISAAIAGIPAIALLGGYVLFAGPILAAVFGDAYAGGAPFLAILAFGQLVNAWTGSCGVALIMTGHERSLMVVTVVSGVLIVLLNIALVQRFGVTGVAVGTASGIAFQNVLLWIVARWRVGVWTNLSLAGIRESAQLLRRPQMPWVS